MISKQEVSLTIENLTGQLSVFVKTNDSCRVTWMDADDSIKRHDGIRSQDEVLGVALLRLVGIVQHVLLMHD